MLALAWPLFLIGLAATVVYGFVMVQWLTPGMVMYVSVKVEWPVYVVLLSPSILVIAVWWALRRRA